MFKSVSRFLTRNPRIPASQLRELEVPVSVYAVVYFFYRRDNVGRRRPFRYVKPFSRENKARKKFLEVGTYPYSALLRKGDVVEERGDAAIVEEWMETRRGINTKVVDPITALDYGERECWGKEAKKNYFD